MIFAKKTTEVETEGFWNVLIVDDENDVHTMTKLVMKDFQYKNKKIKFYDAYSIDETKKLLNSNIDFSLILLDIIMEVDDAGLLLTKYIREELKNSLIRIILCTGQPGSAPEDRIIFDYDINDYKEKTELTTIKLKTAIISSFRSYEELKKIIKHEKALEQQVAKNVIELRKKDKIIQYKNRVSQDTKLLNMLAHQWRQPLSIISANANNLLLDIELDSIDKDVFKKTSENIVSTTQELSKQINDFLDHYKPSSSKTDVTVGKLFERVISLAQKRIDNHKVIIIKDIDDEFTFNTYKSELEQIIVHLIDNAIDAYEKNEDLKKVIKLETKITDEKLKIVVQDLAGGLSDDIKDKIFIPYFTTKEKLNDTGLGLYMSKLLVEEHLNGELNIFNKNNGCVAELIIYLI